METQAKNLIKKRKTVIGLISILEEQIKMLKSAVERDTNNEEY